MIATLIAKTTVPGPSAERQDKGSTGPAKPHEPDDRLHLSTLVLGLIDARLPHRHLRHHRRTGARALVPPAPPRSPPLSHQGPARAAGLLPPKDASSARVTRRVASLRRFEDVGR
jgi:hypothetical protein